MKMKRNNLYRALCIFGGVVAGIGCGLWYLIKKTFNEIDNIEINFDTEDLF